MSTTTDSIAPIALPPCPNCGAKCERDQRGGGRITCTARGAVILAWLRAQPREDREQTRIPRDLCDGVCNWQGHRREFDVPRDALAGLGDRFAKIGKRAAKIGVVAPSFEVAGYFLREWKDIEGTKRITEMARVIVSGNAPRINGWEFIARIDHIEEGNLIATHSAAEIPARFRTAPCVCEHCNLSRRRLATYLLRSDDGAWKQVGSSCLTDFLGHPRPETVAALAEFWGDVIVACEDASDRDEEGGGGRDDGYGMMDFMARVAQAIRLYGWVSRKTAEERCMISTCSEALAALNPPRMGAKPPRPEQIDRDRAAAAIEWARSLPEDSDDYLWNLRTAARRDYVTRVTIGLMASALPAYDRSLAKRAAKRPSEWIGAVKVKGDKRYKAPTFRLTVDRVITREGAWGTTHFHVMRDTDGNAVTWKSSTTCLDQGRTYDVTGTVEEHEVYVPKDAPTGFPGIRQTKLARCKAVLVPEHPTAEEQGVAA
jgi:hypothetical protein